MNTQNSQYAYFSVHGDFDPAIFSDRAGVAATKSWKKGDAWKPNRDRAFSHWALESRLDHSQSLEDHIKDVLAQLDAREGSFKALTVEYECWMQLVGYFWERYPGLHLERDIIVGLAKYRLSVDFDFYGFEGPDQAD